MANFSCYMPDSLTEQLRNLESSEKIALDMLDSASPILEERVKNECAKHKRTGNMYKSIKRTKAKRTSNGAYITVVRPTGTTTEYIDNKGVHRKRKTPVRNMEIMAYMEYGTSKQAGTPVLSKAVNDSKDKVTDAMQEAFNKATERG